MTKKTYAVVDFGTNSARLMLAQSSESGINTLSKTLETIRLGDGIKDNRITMDAMIRAKETTLRFLRRADDARCDAFYCFATSAVRDAVNADEFCTYVKETCGVDIDVISGEKEARIGYIGASRGSSERLGIIDIGGGSTEIVIGDNGAIEYAHSFQTGTVRLLKHYPDASPIRKSDYTACQKDIIDAFAELPRNIAVDRWVAIGGTATAAAAIDLSLETYDPERVDGHQLSLARITELYHRFEAQTVEQRKNTTGLEEKRADVIVFGALLLKTVLELVQSDKLTVSESDNQEGYLIEKLKTI